MNKNHANIYIPNIAIHPGVTLQELIKSIDMTQTQLAQVTGLPYRTVHGIIQGEIDLTSDMANRFELAFQLPASFWVKLQNNYNNVKNTT